MAVSCLVFGGIHVSAWRFAFPSKAEQLAWRVASLTSMLSPVAALLGTATLMWLVTHKTRMCEQRIVEMVSALNMTRQEYEKHVRRRYGAVAKAINVRGGIVYTVSRVALIALMFSSLREVPDAVYDRPDWTRFVPSFS